MENKYSFHSFYEMLIPDHMEKVKGRKFGRGEGVALLQRTKLHFIKIPTVRDYEHMKQMSHRRRFKNGG